MKKYILIIGGSIIVAVLVNIGIGYFQNKSYDSERLVVDSKQKLASTMNETETLRYFMTQIYSSEEFLSDDAEQLPNAWGGNIKNRLLWKPSPQELVANPDWVETLNGYIEDGAPKGYYVASPMMLHTYDVQGETYAYVFAQTATKGYSHASGSDIGAGVFKKENDIWRAVFISKNINKGIGGSANAGSLSSFLIGENKYAYHVGLSDGGQGSFIKDDYFYYFDGTNFNNIFYVRASGDDGSGCLNKGKENGWEEDVVIDIDKIDNSGYYDLILIWSGTTAKGSYNDCQVVPLEKTERYHWGGSKYDLVK